MAARNDERGVLILSCFTGAARELSDALKVNPYDIDQTAEAIRRPGNGTEGSSCACSVCGKLSESTMFTAGQEL